MDKQYELLQQNLRAVLLSHADKKHCDAIGQTKGSIYKTAQRGNIDAMYNTYKKLIESGVIS